MKPWKKATAALVCAIVLAGCGGGDGDQNNGVGFTQMVTFGDSLSDVGTYRVGSIAALGGGKWTVNSPAAKNWTEVLAAQYGLPAPCAAQTGLFPLIPGFTGAPIQNFPACRSYAQGSARVTSAFGPNSTAVQSFVSAANGGGAAGTAAAAAAAPLGLMAVPIVTQMNTHLANVGGSFSGKELVVVMAGGNDVFMNLNGVASAAGGGAGAVGGAVLAGWDTATQQAVAGGGAAAASAAQAAAIQGMAQAATELSTYIKTLVIAKGAKFVSVVNLPDVSQTPYVVSLGAQTQGLVSAMVTRFNSTLEAALAGTSGVLVVDAYAQGRAQYANPALFGLSNVTVPACSTTTTANPLKGSSITCTDLSTIPGDTTRYQFADNVHPTPYGYKLLADFVIGKMVAAGWRQGLFL
ncbi:MAG: SGNH/GDSL hydrolase family protein [Polaromonas sp.]